MTVIDEPVVDEEAKPSNNPLLCSVQCLGCHAHLLWDRKWLTREANVPQTDSKAIECQDRTGNPTCGNLRLCRPRSIVIFYIIALVAGIAGCILVPTTLFFRGAGPGRSCYDYEWTRTYIDADCWMSLVNVDAIVEWFDVAILASSVVVVIAAVVAIVAAAVTRSRWVIYTVGSVIMITSVVTFACVTAIALSRDRYDQQAPREMHQQLTGQLQMSLYQLNTTAEVKATWDAIHAIYCCCGVEGYSDFRRYGDNSVPESCTCLFDENRESYYTNDQYMCYGISQGQETYYLRNNCVNNKRVAIDDMNVTTIGCLSSLDKEMNDNYRTVFKIMWPILLAIGLVQFIMNLMAMCSASAAFSDPFGKKIKAKLSIHADDGQRKASDVTPILG